MPEVLCIDADGTRIGVIKTYEALRRAEEQGLNLVEVSPNARPPVCKILDYGKFKYDQKRDAKRRKKSQVVIDVKEVKFRPKVDKHDFEFKVRHAIRFLSAGDKVKCTIMFRGREMAHTEIGAELLKRVLAQFEDKVVVESPPRLEGRNMSMLIAPKAGAWPKKEAKPEDAEAEDAPEIEADAPETEVEAPVAAAPVAAAPEAPSGSEPQPLSKKPLVFWLESASNADSEMRAGPGREPLSRR